jgi:beta-N-acetylhexosaminidase
MRLSRDPAARRRLAALCLAAALALLLGVVVGASVDGEDGGRDRVGSSDPPGGVGGRDGAGGEDEDEDADGDDAGGDDAPPPVDSLSLRQQVGQVLISSIDGTTRPDYVRRRLRARETAGIILFGRNGGDAAQWRRLTHSLQAPARGRALIMVDQEGGEIRSLAYAGPEAGQPLQGDAPAVRRTARETGRQLRDAGVNVNLAPVADVARTGSVMASRAFGSDPADVAAKTRASVLGLREARVAATAKHFPGLGGSAINTDDASATVAGEIDADLEPYRAAIAAEVPLIMLSHALYPALDTEAIASQSQPIVTGLLRERLGFRNVIVTDSLEAQAVLDRSDVATAAELSIQAGADLMLMTGSASWNEVFPRLLEKARAEPGFRARIRASAARVLALKRRLLG